MMHFAKYKFGIDREREQHFFIVVALLNVTSSRHLE